MNILLLNQDWFAQELRTFGHSVLTCGVGSHLDFRLAHPVVHIDDLIALLPGTFKPDVLVWLDDSAPITFMGLENSDIPTMMYSVDTHHHWELHARLAHCFDHVLVAQKDYLHHFAPSATPATWLPLWASRHVEPSPVKTMPMAFVGTMDPKLNKKRVEFFTALKEVAPITIKQGNYWEIFPMAELVINQTVSGDLNFRVFEAMMCGSMLLTERSPNGLLELFTEGEHLVTYTAGDVNDAALKASALLENPSRLQAIAQAGRERVLSSHTALHRAAVLHDILSSIQKRPKTPARHFPMMINLAIASSLLGTRNPALGVLALQGAIQCALASLKDGCLPSNTESAHLIRTYLRWDQMCGNDMGSKLLVRHAEAFPSDYLLALARIRSLLNQGSRLEAEVVASSISPEPPAQIFSIAEQTVSLILQ